MLRSPSSLSITVKLAILYLILIIDIVLSSFIEPTFGIYASSNHDVAIVLIPIQVALMIVIVVMVTVLIWQTFLLRYGLIWILAREFLRGFLVIVVILGFSIAERLFRLSVIVNSGNLFDQISLWEGNNTYQALYYIRFLCYPIFYGLIIDMSIRLANPEYYQSNRWIQ